MTKKHLFIILSILAFLVIFSFVYYKINSVVDEDNVIETTEVNVYFSNSILDPEVSCSKVFPVKRKVVKTEAIGKATLTELFKGPSDEEKSKGYFSSINPGVVVQSLSIADGIARADFNQALEFQVGGSCRVSAIRWEITETLKQFPTIKDVVISIDGRTEDILQP
ncbi:MAG: GerMN domain-containing protein [Candidatus Paceibacterota bacterium]|jgi:spore germination protein GerM